MALSDSKIKKAKPLEKKYKLHDGEGLYLLVMPNGSKLWKMRYTRNGKTVELSLGKYPYVSLLDARGKRHEAREQLAQGIDPKQAYAKNKKIASGENTFRAVAKKLVEQKEKYVVPKTVREINSKLDLHVFPYIGDMAMDEIQTSDVKEIVQRVDRAGHAYQANRVLGLISEVFRYGIIDEVCQYDVASPLKGFINVPPTKHHPTITDPKRAGEMLADTWLYHGSFRVRMALRLMPYVFLRTQEVRFLKWEEVDFDRKLIVLSAEKMKSRRPHYVPLARQVIDLLTTVKEKSDGEYVFSIVRRGKEATMSNSTINNALGILGYKGEIVGHGFRGMASTMLYETQEYSEELIETQLAHTEQKDEKKAYNHAKYLTHRAKMMQDWADMLDDLRRNGSR